MPKKRAKKVRPARFGLTLRDLPEAVRRTLRKLNDVERAYVLYYCSSARGQSVVAAEMAGIKAKTRQDLSTKAYVIGHRPGVRAAIEAWVEAFALSAAEITERIKDLSEVSFAPFVEWTPNGPKLRAMTDQEWTSHQHWIKSISVDTKSGKIMEVKLHDRMTALKELAKIKKLYNDQPMVALHLHMERLSDAELLAEIERARAELGAGNGVRALPRGSLDGVAEAEVLEDQ